MPPGARATLSLAALIVIVGALGGSPGAHAHPARAAQATEIAGKVTARNPADGTLRVEFEAHPSVGPAVGDQVAFFTRVAGVPQPLPGGKGEVVEVGAGFVWVRPTEDQPGLEYEATISATGEAVAPEPSPSMAMATNPGASRRESAPGATSVSGHPMLPPPDADFLQPRVLGDGVAELLVPVGLPLDPEEDPAFGWGFLTPADFTGEWIMRVWNYGNARRTIEAVHKPLAADYFSSIDNARLRYDNRRIEGGMECVASSAEVAPFYYLWSALCRADGTDYRMYIVVDPSRVSDPDRVAQKIIASLRVGDEVTDYVRPERPPIDALEQQTLGRALQMSVPAGVRMWQAPDPVYEWEFDSGEQEDTGSRWEIWITGDEATRQDPAEAARDNWELTQSVMSALVTERYVGRDIPGGDRCIANSFDRTYKREWQVVCQFGGTLVDMVFRLERARSTLDGPVSPDEGEETLRRMVQSLRLLR